MSEDQGKFPGGEPKQIYSNAAPAQGWSSPPPAYSETMSPVHIDIIWGFTIPQILNFMKVNCNCSAKLEWREAVWPVSILLAPDLLLSGELRQIIDKEAS